jgi:replicative DNA helicase
MVDFIKTTDHEKLASFDQIVSQTYSDLYDEKIKGLSTGFDSLDDIITGFYPGQLITVAGRPGMGKTAFMLSLAMNLANQGKKILFLTLEMSNTELVKRCVSQLAFVPFHVVSLGPKKWQGQVKEKCDKAFEDLKKYPLHLVEKTLSLQHIINTCKSLKRKLGLDIVMIDYLQLIKPTDKVNRYEFIGQVTR